MRGARLAVRRRAAVVSSISTGRPHSLRVRTRAQPLSCTAGSRTTLGNCGHRCVRASERGGRHRPRVQLDAIRRDIEESLGENDAAYIRRTIRFQRTLDVAARVLIGCSRSRAGWVLGTAALAFAKSVENMEIGHNVSHGWDWMNDPEIHSSTWEWDMVAVSSQWRYSHNYRHHVFSNVVGVDDDLGFGIMRVTRDEPWRPSHLLQPLRNVLLASIFEWGIALHGVHSEHDRLAADTGKVAEARAALIQKDHPPSG
jgi:NADPH-dependent stearoyl-CoA 9-desaturase